MTETVVHVTTLEQLKSVLDVWFKQGYEWVAGGKDYHERYFTEENSFYLRLSYEDISKISIDVPSKFIEYSEFMAQQKEDNKMATVYEVSQSVFDELQRIKAHKGTSIIRAIVLNEHLIKSIEVSNKAILRYLADDPAIEFKVKEPSYCLYHIAFGLKIFFIDWQTRTEDKKMAFTASLEKIKLYQTPEWEIEKVDD